MVALGLPVSRGLLPPWAFSLLVIRVASCRYPGSAIVELIAAVLCFFSFCSCVVAVAFALHAWETSRSGHAGQARPGQVRSGQVRSGQAGHAGQARPGQARPGQARPGQPGQAWPGQARPGQARPGRPGQASQASKASQARLGKPAPERPRQPLGQPPGRLGGQ